MLKKTIKYVNYNDETIEEDFFFNLSKAELVELEVTKEGGSFGEHLQRIVAAKDTSALFKEFKNIILLSYGEKSADGKHFIKSPEISDAFSHSAAYDVLFLELMTVENAGIAFVQAIMPADMSEDFKQAIPTSTQTVKVPPSPNK